MMADTTTATTDQGDEENNVFDDDNDDDEMDEDYVVNSTPSSGTTGILRIFGLFFATVVVVLIPLAIFLPSKDGRRKNNTLATGTGAGSSSLNMDDHSDKFKTIYNTITTSPMFAKLKNGEDIEINNPNTPQYLALDWLAYKDPNDFTGDTTELIERYALTVLYFSTKGEKWTDEGNWVTGKHVCQWEHVTCHLSGEDATDKRNYVLELEPEDSNLSGTIPV